MEYIAQPNGTYAAIDEASPLYNQLKLLPKAQRPVFLSSTATEVQAYIASLDSTLQSIADKETLRREALKIMSGLGLTQAHLNALGLSFD